MPTGIYTRISKKVTLVCSVCEKDYIVYPCDVVRRKHCSKKCHAFTSFGEGYWTGKERPNLKFTNAAKTMFTTAQVKGEANRNWKGGVSGQHERFRQSTAYKRWKLRVLKRDNYTCRECGSIENLHVDHIKSFAKYPELRVDENNGRVLCENCHIKTPNWGGKALYV